MATVQLSNGHHDRAPANFELDLSKAAELLPELNRKAIAFIRARPGTAVLAGLFLGLLVGRLVSRR